jgi:hypothetical protein
MEDIDVRVRVLVAITFVIVTRRENSNLSSSTKMRLFCPVLSSNLLHLWALSVNTTVHKQVINLFKKNSILGAGLFIWGVLVTKGHGVVR